MLKTEHYKKNIPDFSLDKVIVAVRYDDSMQRKIRRFKFAHNYVDRVYFESLFLLASQEYKPTGDIIVHPPISPFDWIIRGPNHAAHLAEYFSHIYEKPLMSPFRKKAFAGHQSRRTKKERAQVRKEYLFDKKYKNLIKNKKIILVDDLITTGYTAHTLWKLLKKAWAKEVVGYFLASEKI